jgi:hypothetical protein
MLLAWIGLRMDTALERSNYTFNVTRSEAKRIPDNERNARKK